MALPFYFNEAWTFHKGVEQRWGMSNVQTLNMLLLVGVEFNYVPTEGLIQIPKTGLRVRLVSDVQAILEVLY